jgi:AhpD family alkylhydroperoxidase
MARYGRTVALIPYADEDPRDDRVRELVERLRQPSINLFRMLANAPALAGSTLRLGETILTKGDLDPVLRELVILRAAVVTGTEYEWVQHEAIARMVGVSDEKISAVRNPGDEFDPQEVLVLQLVDGVIGDGTPSAELVTTAASELGRAELIEVLLIAGYYAMLGGVMRAVRLDVDSVVEKGMLEGRFGAKN